MLIPSSNGPVEVSNSMGSSSFSIAMNAKAFRTLSDSLYQNKIGSIVREICCNAVDGHIANGNVAPFSVHLPDAFEPWFSVRDYGIGLSPNAIETVFTKYFESTKDQSNEMIGSFGLGAKSPFSYSDNFTVTSVTGGISRAYSAYIAEDGLPRIDLMVEFESDVSTGVEIKIGVKPEDFNKFRDELKDQLRFFETKPEVLNSNYFSWHPDFGDTVFESENIVIYSRSPGYYDTKAYIVQGNVGYPLDVSQLKDKVSDVNLNILKGFQNNIVVYKFNIGEIGVTASREAIEYNKFTVGNIDSRIDIIREELNEYVMKEIANLDTPWNKAKFLNKHQVLREIAVAAGIEIEGANIVNSRTGTYTFDFGSALCKTDDKGKEYHVGYVKNCYTNKPCSSSIAPFENTKEIIFVRDTANRPSIRVKYYCNEHGISLDSAREVVLHDRGSAGEILDKVKNALGGYDNVVLVSSIELPKNVSDNREYKTYVRPKYYAANGSFNDYIRNWSKEYENLKEIEDEMLYVVIEDMRVIDKPLQHSSLRAGAYSSLSIMQALVSSNMLNKADIPELIAIRAADVKRIEGKDNFISLNDYVVKTLDGINFEALKVKLKHNTILKRADSILGTYVTDELISELTSESVLTKVASFLKRKVDTNASSQYYSLSNMFNIGGTCGKLDESLHKVKENLLKRYPMLAMVNVRWHENKPTAKQFADYIRMVDAA